MEPYVRSLPKITSTFTQTPVLPGPEPTYSESQQDSGYEVLDNVTGYNGPRKPGLPVNPQTYRKQVYKHCIGRRRLTGPTYTETFYGVLRPAIAADPGTSLESQAWQKAVGRFLGTLRDTDLNLATSLAEGKQTLQMVSQALRSVASWRKSAVSLIGDIGAPLQKGSRAAANRWLEAVFGWRPLLADAYNLATFTRNYRREFEVRSSGTVHTVDKTEFDDGGYRNTVITRTSTRCIISRRFRVRDQNAFDLNRLTSLNPFSIAWELTPLSFVVDWWLDIGGYLQNLETAFGLGTEIVAERGYNTFTTKSYSDAVVTPYLPSTGVGFGSYEVIRKNRVKDDTMPFPSFPRLKSTPLGGGQMISAAALVRQKLPDRISGRSFLSDFRR